MKLNVMLFGLCAFAVSEAAEAGDRLASMLGYVPADAVAAGPAAPVEFVDLAAMRQTSSLGIPLFERFRWTADDLEVAALSRHAVGPQMIADYLRFYTDHRIESTTDYLGFAWRDIEAAIGFYAPPDSVTVLQGTAAMGDVEAVDAALTGRGFTAEHRAGHPFWWRLDDNQVDVAGRDTADPLRGAIGGSARAGLVDGAFVTAANWPAIDRALLASGSGSAALAAQPDFAALARALDRPVTGQGHLVQAMLIAGSLGPEPLIAALMAGADENALDRLRQQLAPGPDGAGTPRYRALALADRQEGQEAVGVVALVYDDRGDAETAVRTVPQAFAAQSSIISDRSFSEIVHGAVTGEVIDDPQASRHVALIAFAAALPPREGPFQRPLTPFSRLVQMFYHQDYGPLVAVDH